MRNVASSAIRNWQQRGPPALAELLGVQVEDVLARQAEPPTQPDPVLELPGMDAEPVIHYGSVRPGHPLARGVPESAYFHFHGGFVAFSHADDCDVAADLHVTDEARLHGRPYNRPGIFPGAALRPLVVTRECGRGRAAYVAAEADATRRRANSPELERLMLNAILWAGGPAPLEAPDVPPSVEVRVFHDPARKAFQVVLVNLTTSPLLRPSGSWGVIRYVTPQKALRLSLRTDRKVRAARSLLGTEVRCTAQKDMVHLDAAVLDLYDCIVLEYE